MNTKRDDFLDFCKSKIYVSSVDALSYGLSNGYLGARNVINDFAREGLCERLNWAQKVSLGLLEAENKEIAFYKF